MAESKRNTVLEAIHRNPGLGVRALARATGMATDTIRKHASVLVEGGQVVRVTLDGAFLHYAATDSPGRTHALLDARPPLRDLLDHVATVGPVKQARILEWGRHRGCARSTTQARLKRLVAEGLVHEEPVGGFTYYASNAGDRSGPAAQRRGRLPRRSGVK